LRLISLILAAVFKLESLRFSQVLPHSEQYSFGSGMRSPLREAPEPHNSQVCQVLNLSDQSTGWQVHFYTKEECEKWLPERERPLAPRSATFSA